MCVERERRNSQRSLENRGTIGLVSYLVRACKLVFEIVIMRGLQSNHLSLRDIKSNK